MSYRLCIDIGGTFTDLVAVDEKGQVNIFKSPTTPDDYSRAFIETLKLASEYYGVKLNDLMAQSSSGRGGYLAHGSTVSTNAIIENKVEFVKSLQNSGRLVKINLSHSSMKE